MTNEETLELLKPIMLDGTEKVGDKLFDIRFGECEITQKDENKMYPIEVYSKGNKDDYTINGKEFESDKFPVIFKTNPFEYLAKLNNNQERVIEVHTGNDWVKRVLVTIKNGYAICWSSSESVEDAKKEISTISWKKWRELSDVKSITKEEALKMLAEKGVDTTNLTIE